MIGLVAFCNGILEGNVSQIFRVENDESRVHRYPNGISGERTRDLVGDLD